MTLVIDSRSQYLSLTAQRSPDDFILPKWRRWITSRLSQEQLQHAQQIAARDLRGLAHEIKNRFGVFTYARGAATVPSALPDPVALMGIYQNIIEQATGQRNLVVIVCWGRSTRECITVESMLKSRSAW